MPETADLGRAVLSGVVAHGYLQYPQVRQGRTEDELEVAEWVQCLELRTTAVQPAIVGSPDGFCPTEGILYPLAQKE